MGEQTKTYSGSCHRGGVHFEAATVLATVSQCNCSMCMRAGWPLTFDQPARSR